MVVHRHWLAAQGMLHEACGFWRQAYATGDLRTERVEWLWALATRLHVSADATALAVQYLDRYMTQDARVVQGAVRHVAGACLLAAAKVAGGDCFMLQDLHRASEGACVEADVAKWELRVLCVLRHELALPTVIKFAQYYAHCVAPDVAAVRVASTAACHAATVDGTWASGFPHHAAFGAVAWAVAHCARFATCTKPWERVTGPTRHRSGGAPPLTPGVPLTPTARTAEPGPPLAEPGPPLAEPGVPVVQASAQRDQGCGGTATGATAGATFDGHGRLAALQRLAGLSVDHPCVARVFGAVRDALQSKPATQSHAVKSQQAGSRASSQARSGANVSASVLQCVFADRFCTVAGDGAASVVVAQTAAQLAAVRECTAAALRK